MIFFHKRNNKAQAVAEYAALLAIIAAAIIAIKYYLQRAVQGKVKAMADQISPYQYNPKTGSGSTDSYSETETSGTGTFTMEGLKTHVEGYEETERDWWEDSKGDYVEE